MWSCLKKGQIINKLIYPLLFFLLILGIYGLDKIVVYAETPNLGTDSFSGLVIDEDVLNEPEDMDVVVRNLNKNKYLISKAAYTLDTPIGNYGTGANIKTNMHPSCMKGSGKIYVGFSSLGFNEQKKMLPQNGDSGIVIPLVISSLTGLGSLSYFIRFKRKEV
ncbi:MAG: hypothetical protein ACRCXQ_01775 [Vagococcus fluvialis]